jgi:hypothetical protein
VAPVGEHLGAAALDGGAVPRDGRRADCDPRVGPSLSGSIPSFRSRRTDPLPWVLSERCGARQGPGSPRHDRIFAGFGARR